VNAVTREPYPDAEYEITFEVADIPAFDAPANPLPRQPRMRPIRVIHSR